jgi:hypothetical protein
LVKWASDTLKIFTALYRRPVWVLSLM